jgi:isochorismate hydrolase
MKEIYYTTETIDAQAKEFFDSTASVRKKKPLDLTPCQSVLLVLDMQHYFLQNDSHAYIPSALAIVPNIIRLQDRFLELGYPVIQTRHLNTIENAGQMKSWWRDLIKEENPFSEISDSIRNPHAAVLSKPQYDAFFKTNLEEMLRQQEIESGHPVRHVIITGVMTHLCCETTARSAFMKGYDVYFVVDATATYNRQFHLASLLNLSHGFATPVLTTEIEHLLHQQDQ